MSVATFPGGFSVLMAVWKGDSADLFKRALDSVYANTLRPDQVVLVVDGPVTDAIDSVIRTHVDAHGTEILRLPHNQGLAKALTAGIAHVRFEWIARADADDVNLPTRFEWQARTVLADPALDVTGGAIREVDRDGSPIAVRRPPLTHAEIIRQLPSRSPLNHPAVAYRAELARRVGGYPSLHLKEDYAMWCLFAKAGARFANLDDVLVLATAGRDMYRRRGGLRYIKSEIEMQRLMVRLELKSRVAALLHGSARSLVFAMPGWARGMVYRRLLRSGQ